MEAGKKRTTPIALRLCEIYSLLFVVLIIAPDLLIPHRVQSNDSAAIGNLRTVVGAETAYKSAKGTYTGNWEDMTLANPPFLDGNWAATKNGYNFILYSNGQSFTCTANAAEQGVTGTRGFFTDETGVIRASKGPNATVADTPIGQ
jgi:hypothetical protein